MENNEKLDWKPEVGKTAWAVNRRSLAVVECVINAIYGTEPYVVADVSSRTRGGSWLDKAMVVYPTAEAALAANPLKVYDLEGKEVVIPRARSIFEGDDLHRFLRDEAGYTERLDSEIKWYSAEVPQKDPNEKTWENVVDAYSTFKEARMGHQEFYRYMDSQLDELVRSREYVHTMKMLHEGGGAAIGGKSDQREGGC